MENYRSPKAKQESEGKGGRRQDLGGGCFAGICFDIEISFCILSINPFLPLCYKYSRSLSYFHSTSLHYYVDETPKELKSCLFQLAYGKICFSYIQVKVTEPIEKVRWGFTVFSSRIHNLFHLSEDLLYLKFLKYSSTFSSYTF